MTPPQRVVCALCYYIPLDYYAMWTVQFIENNNTGSVNEAGLLLWFENLFIFCFCDGRGVVVTQREHKWCDHRSPINSSSGIYRVF